MSEVVDYDGEDVKINKTRCETCPFNEHGHLPTRAAVQYRVLNVGTQRCHGTSNKTLCRGARDFQLQMLAKTGTIEAPTEEAWQKVCDDIGIKNVVG